MLTEKQLREITWTEELFAAVVAYKRTGAIPPHQHPAKFIETFHDFRLNGNELTYKNKIVVPEADWSVKLQAEYDAPGETGKGLNNLFRDIESRFVGIPRHAMRAFVEGQADWQLTAPLPHIVARGVNATRPMQIFGVDLVDMSNMSNIAANLKNNWVFTCVDAFSGYTWFVAAKLKEAKQIAAAFMKVITQITALFDGEHYPAQVYSDGGLEFYGEFDAKLEEHGITHIRSKSYSGSGIPFVEQRNGLLRNILRRIFVKTKKLVWLPWLDDIAESINSNYVKRLHSTPIGVMEKFFADNNDPRLQNIADADKTKAKARFDLYARQQTFAFRDFVRVALTSISSAARQQKKTNFKAQAVRWSPQVYRVAGVFPPKGDRFGYTSVTLLDSARKLVRTPAGTVRLFRSTELLHVPNDAVHLSWADANRLNMTTSGANGDETARAPAVQAALPAPPPPRPPKPVANWQGADWRTALVGREFDSEGVRCRIVAVVKRSFNIEYRRIKPDGSLASQTLVQTLRDALADAHGEPWYRPEFSAV